MVKLRNSTLERRTPLRAKKGLKSRKRINPKSDRQRAKDELWNRITDEKCYETGFICLWCGVPGQRNDNTRFDYLDGHHTRKPRRNHNKKEYCYPAHRAPCHGEIDDNNINVEEYPNKEAWERRQKDGTDTGRGEVTTPSACADGFLGHARSNLPR